MQQGACANPSLKIGAPSRHVVHISIAVVTHRDSEGRRGYKTLLVSNQGFS